MRKDAGHRLAGRVDARFFDSVWARRWATGAPSDSRDLNLTGCCNRNIDRLAKLAGSERATQACIWTDRAERQADPTRAWPRSLHHHFY